MADTVIATPGPALVLTGENATTGWDMLRYCREIIYNLHEGEGAEVFQVAIDGETRHLSRPDLIHFVDWFDANVMAAPAGPFPTT